MNSSVSIDSPEMTHKKSRSLLQDYAINQQTAENKIYRSELRIYACDTRERVTLNKSYRRRGATARRISLVTAPALTAAAPVGIFAPEGTTNIRT